jgi:hypothetical protein
MLLEELKKNTETSVGITDFRADILTRDHPNTYLYCYVGFKILKE